jgi:hypothetical protein
MRTCDDAAGTIKLFEYAITVRVNMQTQFPCVIIGHAHGNTYAIVHVLGVSNKSRLSSAILCVWDTGIHIIHRIHGNMY